MTKVKSQSRWVRIGPRKLMRVVDSVRGKMALEAINLLKFMPQKGARVLEKVLKSAVANAKNNYKLEEASLVVSEAFVNKGITMKRWQAVARGRVHPIMKRTSHLTVFVSPKAEVKTAKPKAEKAEKQSKEAKK